VKTKISYLTLVIILIFSMTQIKQKEKFFRKADEIYLKLAPIDPRSMIQGDYMRLNYEILETIHYRSKGYIIVALDDKRVGRFVRFEHKLDRKKLKENEYPIRVKNRKIKSMTFFFQEGAAKAYEQAVYGKFKADKSGDLILRDLVDDNLGVIKGGK